MRFDMLRLCLLILFCTWTDAWAGDTVLWGSYGGPACQGQQRLKDFDDLVGHPQTIVLDFLSFDSWQSMGSTARLIARCHPSRRGRRLVLSVPLFPKGGPDQLYEVGKGERDADFQAIARALVAHGHIDAIIRLGWEFNGGWYPWTSRGRETDWRTAWRRAVIAMRAVEGQSFLFDWTYALSDVESYAVEQAYPGDDVVDIIGADFYNQTWFRDEPTEALQWRRYLEAPRGLNWLKRFAGQRGKKISLPEWGTGFRPDGHGGGDSSAFVNNTLSWIDRANVLYHGYWNYPAKDYRAELFSDDLQQARKAYVEGMRARLSEPKSGEMSVPSARRYQEKKF